MSSPVRFALLSLPLVALLSACAGNKPRFIEPTTLELGHAPGPASAGLGEDGYLQVQVSSNLGEEAERLKFYGDDAPKLVVVTARLQPLTGPQRDTTAPEVPLLTYDVSKGASEELTARTLAGGIVVKAGSLSGAATLTLIVRGITASGATALAPLMETVKRTPAAITGAATALGGVPIVAFQTFVVPLLERSTAETRHQWERKKEYTFQVGDRLDSLDGRVVAFLLLTEDRKGGFTINAELCSIEVEQPKLCLADGDAAGKPVRTPYLLFDLHVSDYRPIDDLVPQGGPCATSRPAIQKTFEAIGAGALTARQAFLEELLLQRRVVLADIRDSGGSLDRLSRAAWRYQRLRTPAVDDRRHDYWQRYFAARSARLDACIDDTLATATPTTRRHWAVLLDGFRAVEDVETAVARNADLETPLATDVPLIETALRRLGSADALPAIDAESRAWLVSSLRNAEDLLDRWYRAEVLQITATTDSVTSATRSLRALQKRTRCSRCAGSIDTALAALRSGASVDGAEALVRGVAPSSGGLAPNPVPPPPAIAIDAPSLAPAPPAATPEATPTPASTPTATEGSAAEVARNRPAVAPAATATTSMTTSASAATPVDPAAAPAAAAAENAGTTPAAVPAEPPAPAAPPPAP